MRFMQVYLSYFQTKLSKKKKKPDLKLFPGWEKQQQQHSLNFKS